MPEWQREGIRAEVGRADEPKDERIAYEPFPGAFDGILGADEREG